MKAILLCALCIPVLLSACSSFPRIFMPDQPKIDEYGTFNVHGFNPSTCINKDKNIHIIMDGQVISIESKKLIDASIEGETYEQRALKIEAIHASENINSLGCKENPYPANKVWITTDFKKRSQSSLSHSFYIGVKTQTKKDEYAFIEKSIAAANQLPNCKVNDTIKTCKSVEDIYHDNDEQREVIYRTWSDDSITLQSGAVITERCILPKDDNGFWLGDMCRISAVLPTGYIFDFNYFYKSHSDHIEAVDAYKTSLAYAIELTQK